jgi:pimeloyl-ACP methyl ester carboxylesterase
VTGPTIVLHGEDDPYLPVAHGRHTAELIPNARFVLLRGQGHVALIREIPQLCADVLGLARKAAP